MIRLKSIARVLVAVIVASLSSCIDCREEYWLKADGSGRAELTYRIPAAVAAMHGGESGIRDMLTGFLQKTPEIADSRCDVVTENNRIRVSVSASFRSAMALQDVVSGETMKTLPSAASCLAGNVEAKMEGRTLDFSRRIIPASALPDRVFFRISQIEGHRLTYIMHLPAAAEESNATRTEEGGRTLVWDLPLKEAIKEPVVTRFRMQVPVPWQLVSAIAVPITLVSGGWLIYRRRKSRTRFPVGNPGAFML